MKCPNCGFNGALNGSRCGDCGFYITGPITAKITFPSRAEPNPIVPDYSGLEKIESIDFYPPVIRDGLIEKLNEVIEKVNMIIDYLNQVKK